MSLSLEPVMNEKMKAVFAALQLDEKFALVKFSDRPDLSDFQCNGALAMAKILKQNPREIAEKIAAELQKDSAFAAVSIDGPGFINLKLKDELIAQNLNEILADKRLGIATLSAPQTMVLDYGGPNVAKAMHVGHLRAGTIGESIKRIEKFLGNRVIGDVHFGDWGTPIGMIIAQVLKENSALDALYVMDVDQITEVYKRANILCKEDENAKETARVTTAKMQDGDAEYRKAWKYIRDVSVDDVKKNYANLNVSFDLWWGESDSHETCAEIVQIAKDKGLAEQDDGALIVRLKQGNKPKPPVILVKSDGAYGYQMTDIATIKKRVDELKAQSMVYVVDQRQALHFEQVFETAEMLGIAPNVYFKHIGFGTVNGQDGKPFKTRDGGVMSLSEMIRLSKEKVRSSMPTADEAQGYSAEEIEKMVAQIAIGAIKFQDLKNNIASGYIFDLDNFANFDGKTGPYIQYAIARINSILRKAGENKLDAGKIVLSNENERKLALDLEKLNPIIWRAHTDFEPSIIADFAYALAQSFSAFYNTSPILNEENQALAQSRLAMALAVKRALELLLDLLGIEAPEVMLKK